LPEQPARHNGKRKGKRRRAKCFMALDLRNSDRGIVGNSIGRRQPLSTNISATF